MSRNKITVEWNTTDNEQAWQTSAPASGLANVAWGESVIPTESPGELRLASVVVALFLLLAGGWLWHRQVRMATLAQELQAAAVRDMRTQPVGGASSHPLSANAQTTAPGQPMQPNGQSRSSLLATTTGYQPDVQIDKVQRQGERVMVPITVSYTVPGGKVLPYRETHFYRQKDEGWVRTDPDPDLMGPWQTLETDHFTIRYRPIDGQAVTEAAPRLDLLYDKLRRDFGLQAAVAISSITVEVATDELRDGYDYSFATRTIRVPSPAMISVPVEMTAVTVLYQSVVYPLAKLAVLEAIKLYPHEWKRWQPLLDALPLWALWEYGGLATGRQDVVRWLYHNAQAGAVDGHQVLPEGYERLCHAYRLWGLFPWQMSIPLTCRNLDESYWSDWAYAGLLLRLDDPSHLGQHHVSEAADRLPKPSRQVVTAETIIEYSVATYGREQLPHLIAVLDEHVSWQTLIPAVFGVSAVQFESGWRTYLEQQYGFETE